MPADARAASEISALLSIMVGAHAVRLIGRKQGFGPVLCASPFRHEHAAMANDAAFRLSTTIHTQNSATADKRVSKVKAACAIHAGCC
ncbi:hypothetical protein BN439_3789 [Erwinia amylovora Ea644]|uniref:aldehyde dehydrogenase family protein n=2 Tax=Erwinia amylovora TaxID=552 RepID=UPI0002CB5CB2|nr:hypothetical protein BN439_3789 [Erwinia amylovora Ea644]